MDKGCIRMKRRSFLLKLTAALGGIAAISAIIPGLGFFFAPFVREKKSTWQNVGKVSEFKENTTTLVTLTDPSPLQWAGVIAKTAAWLRRKQDGTFIAFSVNCTHLGCPVRWISDADLFMCPCHGGVYTKEGDVAGGPPPKPLVRYAVRILADDVQVLMTELPVA
jgi:menaquinol-cytochrome c reductase iron-sulfur subunit